MRRATTVEELDALLAAHGAGPAVLYFWANFYAQRAALDATVEVLASANPAVLVVSIEAERVPPAAARYGVSVVPTFVCVRNGQPELTLTGAKTAEVAQWVGGATGLAVPPPAPAAAPAPAATATEVSESGEISDALRARLTRLTAAEPVMLFMKGSPDEPKCGFSRTTVGVLRGAGVRFGSFDILTDQNVRQGLKTFSDWPTFPQLYVQGELVGGLDIIQEMAEGGNLAEQLGLPSLEKRLTELTRRAPVMLFMKGVPDEPRCGFSRQIIGVLREAGVQFDSFDILTDEEVRQGLKTFSDWPTFPQLYVQGELVGGLDIVQEMHQNGELAALTSS